MPHLEERGDFLAVLFRLTTLAKGIVAHRPHFAAAVKQDDMVDAGGNHIDFGNVFDQDRVLDDKLAMILWLELTEHHLFSRRSFLLDAEDIDLAVFGDHEHPLPCEGRLLDFRSPRQRHYFDKWVSDTIRHLFDLNRAHLCLGADI